MANESAIDRILRVLDESQEISEELKPSLKQAILLVETSPTVAGFQKIVEKGEQA